MKIIRNVMRWRIWEYIGLKEKIKPEIFESEKTPTKETHPNYDIILWFFQNEKRR